MFVRAVSNTQFHVIFFQTVAQVSFVKDDTQASQLKIGSLYANEGGGAGGWGVGHLKIVTFQMLPHQFKCLDKGFLDL